MTSEQSFKELKDEISSALISTTRTATQIAIEDLTFQRSINPKVDRLIEEHSRRLLSLVQQLNKAATAGTDTVPPTLTNVDSVEDGWRGIVDVVDNLLEKADACLDEFTGVVKKLTPEQQNKATIADAKKPLSKKDYRFQNLPKPQRLFRKVPKNDETAPFRPQLQSKPNAMVPLEESLVIAPTSDGSTQYKHPYETEIKQSAYPDSAYVQSDPIPFLPFESTDATWVDTPEGVQEMLQELKNAKEIAVDLEHHEEHTYVGLVSLMQISTREKDWIVDTLVPWREDLQILNEVFTDPRIIKVFHGSNCDIVWLQRDLGLYIVGLFDTYHASNLLQYPRHGLAYLLQRIAKFDTDKRYQMADWRMRPLPTQMYDYARSDTHFLLYIFDHMRNELLSKSVRSPNGNLVDQVRDLSKAEALQRYERYIYDAKTGAGLWGWEGVLSRSSSRFNRQQFAVFRAVHEWRDKTARESDESIHRILSNKAMLIVAREMPTDMPSLLTHCQPLHKETRKSAPKLLQVIKNAKIEGINGPELKDLVKPRVSAHVSHVSSARAANSLSVNGVPAAIEALPQSTKPDSRSMPATLQVSRFWGPIIDSSTEKLTTIHPSHASEPHLALPLPPLTAEVFETRTPGESSKPVTPIVDPGARAEHPYARTRKAQEEDVFVLKQAGGSKKRRATEVLENPEPEAKEDRASGNEIEIIDGKHEDMEMPLVGIKDEQKLSEKARRRQERKTRKKLKKEQEKQDELRQINDAGEVEIFDYEKAPSVLHARKEKAGTDRARKGYDPYAKSLDAPKGMRKMQKEGPGKSMTYKT